MKLNPGESIILEKDIGIAIFTKFLGFWVRNRHSFLVKIYLTNSRLYVEQMGFCLYNIALQRIQNVMVGAPATSSSFLDFLSAFLFVFNSPLMALPRTLDMKRGVSIQFKIEKGSPNPVARGRLVTLFLDARDDTDLWFRKIQETRSART